MDHSGNSNILKTNLRLLVNLAYRLTSFFRIANLCPLEMALGGHFLRPLFWSVALKKPYFLGRSPV